MPFERLKELKRIERGLAIDALPSQAREKERFTMKYEDLSDELKAKVQACKTPEDILALAKEEGYELNDEEIEAVSGGKRLRADCLSFKSSW